MRAARITGVEAVVSSLQKKAVKHKRAVRKGLMAAAERLKQASQEVVPVDTGALHDSCRIREADKGTDTKIIFVGYGSVDVDYALIVHENLAMHHQPGKTAEYLRRPARELRTELRQIINTVAAQHIK